MKWCCFHCVSKWPFTQHLKQSLHYYAGMDLLLLLTLRRKLVSFTKACIKNNA